MTTTVTRSMVVAPALAALLALSCGRSLTLDDRPGNAGRGAGGSSSSISDGGDAAGRGGAIGAAGTGAGGAIGTGGMVAQPGCGCRPNHEPGRGQRCRRRAAAGPRTRPYRDARRRRLPGRLHEAAARARRRGRELRERRLQPLLRHLRPRIRSLQQHAQPRLRGRPVDEPELRRLRNLLLRRHLLPERQRLQLLRRRLPGAGAQPV